LKKENPDAKIIVHPECELPVRMIADFIGSTSALLQFTKRRQWKLLYCCN
jgi:quinolinate synthase